MPRHLFILAVCALSTTSTYAAGFAHNENFVVYAPADPTQEEGQRLANQVLKFAGVCRREIATDLLGIELPPGVPALASSPASAVQAFRHGEHAYGLQFHLEVDRNLIERWLTVPANQGLLTGEAGRVNPDDIRAQTPGEIDALEALSRRTFQRWIDRFEIGPRRRVLASR